MYVVLFWNRCLENWTKIPRTEILGENLCDRYTKLNQSKYQLRFKQVFQSGFPAIFSPQLHQSLIPCLQANGQERIHQTTVNAIPADNGAGFYALVTLQDITDLSYRLKKFQQELTERKKIQVELERSNADAKRMEALIRDLLTYSRLSVKGKPFESTNCEKVLDLTISNLQLLIKETSTSISRNPLPTLLADRSQLLQLWQNLLTNAIKYRSDEPLQIEVGAEALNGQWRFYVKDNGIGIDSSHFERVFDIFQRLHTREQYPGTGIGLAVCQKIVDRHGGKIWVESESGQGSIFYFTIPILKTK